MQNSGQLNTVLLEKKHIIEEELGNEPCTGVRVLGLSKVYQPKQV
jgi:hypothetical protein